MQERWEAALVPSLASSTTDFLISQLIYLLCFSHLPSQVKRVVKVNSYLYKMYHLGKIIEEAKPMQKCNVSSRMPPTISISAPGRAVAAAAPEGRVELPLAPYPSNSELLCRAEHLGISLTDNLKDHWCMAVTPLGQLPQQYGSVFPIHSYALF